MPTLAEGATTPGCSGTSTTRTAAACRTTVVTITRYRRRRGVGAPGAPRSDRAICRLGAGGRHLRHDVTGKILLPVYWSPLQEVDLASVPTDGASTTVEPVHGGHRLAVRAAGRLHPVLGRDLLPAARPRRRRLLDIQACFQVAHGTLQRREAMLWQKIDASNNYAVLSIC